MAQLLTLLLSAAWLFATLVFGIDGYIQSSMFLCASFICGAIEK